MPGHTPQKTSLLSRIGNTLGSAITNTGAGLGGLLGDYARSQAGMPNLTDQQAMGLLRANAAGTGDAFIQNMRAEEERQRRQQLAQQLMGPSGLLSQSSFATAPQRAVISEMLSQNNTLGALQGLSNLETAYNSRQAMIQAAQASGVDPATLSMLEGMDAASIQTFLEEERDRTTAEQRTAFDQANALRDEFTSQSEGFEEREDKFAQIKRFAEDPSAAGDIAMIFAFMKLLDPNSVVREGEYATAAAAGPLIDTRTRGLYNQLIRGERLLPSQRADFMSRASDLYKAALEGQSKRIERYTSLSENYGLDFNKDVLPGVAPRFSQGDLDAIDYDAIRSKTSEEDPTMSRQIGQRIFQLNGTLAQEAALILSGDSNRPLSELGLTESEARDLIDIVAEAAEAAGIDL